uniref:G-protein coupled receptors family 1 profile domain-containing protein n=1 Tax=Monodelphis domestica TaxID=13616 RepID=A0A5F8GQT1_MONDO
MRENITNVTEFILVGFPTTFWLQILLFILFLRTYLLVLVENLVIILTVLTNVSLHKPMYYFLGASKRYIWYITVTVPKMLAGFLLHPNTISFLSCMTQFYFFLSLACTECVLLAAIAYDHYVAICQPPHYPVIMTVDFCIQLTATSSWICGFSIAVIKVYFISCVTFCGNNVLNHFFCDVSPILKLACKNISMAEMVDFILAIVILVFHFLAAVLSYGFIISTVLHIPSASGQQKAFSTCGSHLTVVIIFYMAVIFVYVQPRAIASFNSNKPISAIYVVFTPMLNPIIYCLRNQKAKSAIRKTLSSGWIKS